MSAPPTTCKAGVTADRPLRMQRVTSLRAGRRFMPGMYDLRDSCGMRFWVARSAASRKWHLIVSHPPEFDLLERWDLNGRKFVTRRDALAALRTALHAEGRLPG